MEQSAEKASGWNRNEEGRVVEAVGNQAGGGFGGIGIGPQAFRVGEGRILHEQQTGIPGSRLGRRAHNVDDHAGDGVDGKHGLEHLSKKNANVCCHPHPLLCIE